MIDHHQVQRFLSELGELGLIEEIPRKRYKPLVVLSEKGRIVLDKIEELMRILEEDVG